MESKLPKRRFLGTPSRNTQLSMPPLVIINQCKPCEASACLVMRA
jgi:hypothetical protein